MIVVIDDPELQGRPGEWEVGSGWWRYLVRKRGLRPARVRMLHNQAASASAITRAVRRMEDQAGAGSMLWLIYIGGAVSPIDSRLRGSLSEARAKRRSQVSPPIKPPPFGLSEP